MTYEQIKQAAFIDELEKIALKNKTMSWAKKEHKNRALKLLKGGDLQSQSTINDITKHLESSRNIGIGQFKRFLNGTIKYK